MPNLKKNSIHAQFYFLMYGGWAYPPNLCPYFWKIVFASIVFLPVMLFHLPCVILRGIAIYIREKEIDLVEEGWLSREDFCASLLVNLILYLLVSMVAIFFTTTKAIVIGGGIGYIALTIALIVWVVHLIHMAIKKITARKIIDSTYVEKQNRHNLVVEFVKAKYNKHCPKINWEE